MIFIILNLEDTDSVEFSPQVRRPELVPCSVFNLFLMVAASKASNEAPYRDRH